MEDIIKKAADTRKEQDITSQGRVHVYKQTLWDMYQGTDLDVKAACEEDAKTLNNFHLEKPAPSEIYAYMHPMVHCTNEVISYHRSSQPDLKYDMVAALRSLTGWEWGRYGDVIFFAMGAY